MLSETSRLDSESTVMRRKLNNLRSPNTVIASRTLAKVLIVGLLGIITSFTMPLITLPVGVLLTASALCGLRVIGFDACRQKFLTPDFASANDLLATLCLLPLLQSTAFCKEMQMARRSKDNNLAFVDVMLKNVFVWGSALFLTIVGAYHGYFLSLLK